MKLLNLLFLGLLLMGATSAQTSSNPAPTDAPGVKVAQFRWRQEVFVPALYDDPTPIKKIASNTPVGSTPMGIPLGDEPVGNRNLPARSDPGVSSVHYLYEAKISNTGVKTIRTIVWE